MLKKNNLIINLSNKNYYINYLKNNKILITITNINKFLRLFLKLNFIKNKFIIKFLIRIFFINLINFK